MVKMLLTCVKFILTDELRYQKAKESTVSGCNGRVVHEAKEKQDKDDDIVKMWPIMMIIFIPTANSVLSYRLGFN